MRQWASLAVFLLLRAQSTFAQSGPALSLPAPNGRLREEFSGVVSVRELADGRVLVSDERESRVVLADFATGNVRLVGRNGSGPGEYRRASELFALPNDSTLMPQDNAGNWILFSGGSVPSLLTPGRTLGAAGFAMLGGVDASGNVLILTIRGPQSGVQGLDSLDVLLHARATHREQNIGRARSPYGAPPGSASAARGGARKAGDGSNGRPSPAGFFLMDRAVLFPDGWVAIVRLQPYRVDWRAPDGTLTIGPVLAPNRSYEDRDKRASLERQTATAGKPIREVANVVGWPDFLPAFAGIASPVIAALDGKLWVARTVSAAQTGSRYDVVDRHGELVGVLMLAANERVVGFGTNTVYVAVSDGDGIQRVRRHPRP